MLNRALTRIEFCYNQTKCFLEFVLVVYLMQTAGTTCRIKLMESYRNRQVNNFSRCSPLGVFQQLPGLKNFQVFT